MDDEPDDDGPDLDVSVSDDRAAEARRLYPWLPPDADLGLDAHLDASGAPRVITRRFEVGLDFAGWRLDHYLKQQIPRLSRTRIQAIVEGQLVRDDGRPLKPATTVAAGDAFTLRRAARPEPPCPRSIAILLDDPSFVVVDKPAGLPVHASAKFYFNTLTTVLRERFGEDAPQICHRLDRETSGALVCAKTRAAAAALKGAFASKRVAKTYLAVVHGAPAWDACVIDTPLAVAREGDGTELVGVRMVPRALVDGGLPAETRVEVVTRAGAHTLVRCRPVTGRQHQIRVHLALAGFPIVGDKLYTHGDDAFRAFCDGGLTPALAARFGLPRQALHAAEVAFPHPDTGATVCVASPLPPELRALVDVL